MGPPGRQGRSGPFVVRANARRRVPDEGRLAPRGRTSDRCRIPNGGRDPARSASTAVPPPAAPGRQATQEGFLRTAPFHFPASVK